MSPSSPLVTRIRTLLSLLSELREAVREEGDSHSVVSEDGQEESLEAFVGSIESKLFGYVQEVSKTEMVSIPKRSKFLQEDETFLDTFFVLSQRQAHLLEQFVEEHIAEMTGNTTVFKQSLSILSLHPPLQRRVLDAGMHLVHDNEIAFMAALRVGLTDGEVFARTLHEHGRMTVTSPEILRSMLEILVQAEDGDALLRLVHDNERIIGENIECLSIAMLYAESFPEVQRAVLSLGRHLIAESEEAFGASLIGVINHSELLADILSLRPSLRFSRVNLLEGALRLFSRQNQEVYLSRLVTDNLPLLTENPYALRIAIRETSAFPSVLRVIVDIAALSLVRPTSRDYPRGVYAEILRAVLQHGAQIGELVETLLQIPEGERNPEMLAGLLDDMPENRPDITLRVIERTIETIRADAMLRRLVQKHLHSYDPPMTLSIRHMLRNRRG